MEDFYYKKNIEDISFSLKSNLKTGLDLETQQENLKKYGENTIKLENMGKKFPSLLNLITRPLNLVIILLLILFYFTEDKPNFYLAFTLVFLKCLIRTYKKIRLESQISKIEKISNPRVQVIREGQKSRVDTSEIVVGDLVVLKAGDIVPADIRLADSSNLKIDESPITGKNKTIEKDHTFTSKKNLNLEEIINMVFKGTRILEGEAKGIVVATGSNSLIARLNPKNPKQIQEKTSFELEIKKLNKLLTKILLASMPLFFILSFLKNKNFLDSFMVTLVLFTLIPQNLDLDLIGIFLHSIILIFENGALVKNYPSLEKLSFINSIYLDKEGFLTEDKFRVNKIYTNGLVIEVSGKGYTPVGDFTIGDKTINIKDLGDLETILAASSLNNNSCLEKINKSYKFKGDPMEAALISLAAKSDFDKNLMDINYPKLAEIPPSLNRKTRTSFHSDYIPEYIIAFTRGEFRDIIEKSNKISSKGRIMDFNKKEKIKVLKQAEEFSKNSLKVLGFSYKLYESLPKNLEDNSLEDNMIFLGLVTMVNPLNKNIKDFINFSNNLNIRPLVLADDNKILNSSLIHKLGLEGNVYSEDNQPKNSHPSNSNDLNIYAELSEKSLLKLIKELKKNNKILALASNKLKSIEAFERADIGITRTNSSNALLEKSNIILMEDNYQALKYVIKEARLASSNFISRLNFILSSNLSIFILLSLGLVWDLYGPLTSLQIFLINLIWTNSILPPLSSNKNMEYSYIWKLEENEEVLLNKKFIKLTIIRGLSLTISTFLCFKYGLEKYPRDPLKAKNLVFISFILSNFIRSFSSMSTFNNFFKLEFLNKLKIITRSLLLLILILIINSLHLLENTTNVFSLSSLQWKLIFVLSLFPLLVDEILALIIKKS